MDGLRAYNCSPPFPTLESLMMTTFLALAAASWDVLLELAPWLLLGSAVAGLLHGLVPPGLIQRAMRGPGGVVRAVLLGIPLPLCSCGVSPAGIGLQRSGASRGASVGFLIATPQTGVDSVMVAAGFLGWPFALYKVAAALITGVTGGLLVEAIDPGEETREDEAPAHADRSLRGMLAHGIDVIRMIWAILFGVVVSAALTVFLPAGGLETFVGSSAIVGILVVLMASVPLYVCATASVPIAATLVAAGLPTGAALVFLGGTRNERRHAWRGLAEFRQSGAGRLPGHHPRRQHRPGTRIRAPARTSRDEWCQRP